MTSTPSTPAPTDPPKGCVGRSRSLGSVIGTVGVILSLVLVAWEVRQNTVATRAATYDRLGEASGRYYWEVVTNDELSSIFHRIFANDVSLRELAPGEGTRFAGVMLGFLTHLENTWKQYEAGMVSEDVFDGYGWNDGLLERRAFLEWWDGGQPKSFFSAGFVDHLDRHLESLRPDRGTADR